ncbi:hypothetical protein NG726_05685 [Pseudomonas sp. MOB-449]|nr:hypothetical protein [Pseudomonas sp. MOB-449]
MALLAWVLAGMADHLAATANPKGTKNGLPDPEDASGNAILAADLPLLFVLNYAAM